MGDLFVGALAFELEHAALGHQGGDAGHAQLGGLFNEPVHALIGGDACDEVHGPCRFALLGVVRADLHEHVTAAHAQHGGIKLAAGAVSALPAMEQRDGVTRLQAQHLHMPRRTRGQLQLGASGQGNRAVKTGHVLLNL